MASGHSSDRILVAGIGKALQLIEPSNRLRLKAGLRRVGLWEHALNLDLHDEAIAVDPLLELDSLAWDGHG
jgi:hypothetical protein